MNGTKIIERHKKLLGASNESWKADNTFKVEPFTKYESLSICNGYITREGNIIFNIPPIFVARFLDMDTVDILARLYGDFHAELTYKYFFKFCL